MTPAAPDGEPGLPQTEGSDGGASHSSQFELVEEEALSEEDGDAQAQPADHGTEADAAASSATADNTADNTPEPSSGSAITTHQPQLQLEQTQQQHGEGHAPSSSPSASAQAPAASPGSSKADEISPANTSSQPAAEDDSSQRPASAEPSDAEFRQLEERAKQMAQGVQDMASNVSKSLQAGLFTALGSATDATSNIGSLSLGNNLGKLSNWWSNLDATMAAGPATATPEQRTSSNTAGATAADVAVGRNAELVELVGLEAGENLVESFGCKLVQTYACSHNSCTPAIQMTFAGTLFITDRHACFVIEERGKRAPIKILLSQVDTATRERGAHRGDAQDVLKIVVRAPSPAAAGASSSRSGANAAAEQGSGKAGSSAAGGGLFGLLPPVLGGGVAGSSSSSSSSGATHGVGAGSSSSGAGGMSGGGYWVAFKDFEGSAALDNALALVEHLREGA